MAPWIGKEILVRIGADNVYYSHDFVDCCCTRGWDYPVSVTHEGFRISVRECIKGLPETARTSIVLGKEATMAGLIQESGGIGAHMDSSCE